MSQFDQIPDTSTASAIAVTRQMNPIVQLCFNDVRAVVLRSISVLMEESSARGFSVTAETTNSGDLVAAVTQFCQLVEEVCALSEVV